MKILLGVTGSIAAYKSALLLRDLQKRGHEVRVVMTSSAQQFVGELTFRTLSRHPVYCEMFAPASSWRPEHIELGEWPELFVIAPCTANVIAKLAHGLADDLLSATALGMKAPIVVAPAMNDRMWHNAATQENLAVLRKRQFTLVNVGSGDLACGYSGEGRMAETSAIIEAVESAV